MGQTYLSIGDTYRQSMMSGMGFTHIPEKNKEKKQEW